MKRTVYNQSMQPIFGFVVFRFDGWKDGSIVLQDLANPFRVASLLTRD